jgi:catechol 2,3-dioxygenase-like lactoylglutathione lyase family enzyme
MEAPCSWRCSHFVGDLAASRDFYRDELGLELDVPFVNDVPLVLVTPNVSPSQQNYL